MNFKILLFIFTIHSLVSFSNAGDTIHVQAFNKVKIFTDPSDGVNEFYQWGNFPSKSKTYRKVLINVTFQCPDGLHCGEWDYAGSIRLKQIDGKQEDYEIARMMTPYGWYFDSKWSYTWQEEITDFGTLLHDSVQVEYVHSGFENKDDRGWLVTLDFEFIEGNPLVEIMEIKKMWNGHFQYGDSIRCIEEDLVPINTKMKKNENFATFKIIQSGHGMDSKNNCAEFCPKLRTIKINNQLLDERKVWRKCGDNPLYPQAGTWIYDRANWCPGSLVPIENFNFKVKSNLTLQMDLDMEKYIHNKGDNAIYDISSYLFLSKLKLKNNDVSLEKIIQPSNEDAFSRYNPTCSNPKIRIKNNGKNTISTLDILYGTDKNSMQKFVWTGNLVSLDTTTINLPDLNLNIENSSKFNIKISSVNNKKDKYPFDNTGNSIIEKTITFPTKFYLEILTNDSSKYLAYNIVNSQNQIVKDRKLGSMTPNTFYRDTFDLGNNCYRFLFLDTLNVGLDFWAMPEAGYGHIRFYDLNGNLLKDFNSDFGSFEYMQFKTSSEFSGIKDHMSFPMATIFPKINKGKFQLDYVNDNKQDVIFYIEENSTNQKVYEKTILNQKTELIPFEISDLKPGRYTLFIQSGKNTIKKGFRISE